MQYGELITRAFSITWGRKYLWLLGILGGADVTYGFGGNFSVGNLWNRPGLAPGPGQGRGPGAWPAGPPDVAASAGQFAHDNLGLIVVLGLLLLVAAVAWLLLSCVTTGALVRAVAEHDAERPFGLGLAWRTGLGTFGAILGLRLLGLLWALVFAAAIAGLVVLGVVTYASGQTAALGLVVGVGLLVAALLALASIPIGIAFILGTRAVVLEQRGPLAALGRGFGLLRARLGRALLVWLLQVGLGLAAGVVVTIVFFPAVVLFAAVAIAVGVTGGVGAAIVIAIPLSLALAGLGLVVGGTVGAYLSTFWTLAFRRLEIDAPRPVAWPQAPYGAG